jgi:hypothetical protein
MVSFFQYVSNIANILPGLLSEKRVIQVIRASTTKRGDTIINAFKVNILRVLNALYWLQNNNYLYQYIITEKSNLSWIVRQNERSLPNINEIHSEHAHIEDNDR